VNKQETAALLVKIQLGDNREVTDLVVREWHDTIEHLEYTDCVEAVTLHRRESTEYMQPAHVVRLVKRIREERARSQDDMGLIRSPEECEHVWAVNGWCGLCGSSRVA
jgi:hypothetical protein